MQKTEFVDVATPWWLLEQSPDTKTEELRLELSRLLGWDQTWFAQERYVEVLYTEIESRAPQMLLDLDYATEEATRQRWLEELVGLFVPAAPESEQHESEGEHETGAIPGAWNDDWSMLVRTASDGSTQFAFSDDRQTVRSGTDWMSYDEAVAARQREASPESPGESQPAAPSPGSEPAASWDPQWGMFLRYVDGAYQYSLSTHLDDKQNVATPSGQSDGIWFDSAEAATAARTGANQAAPELQALVEDESVEFFTEEVLQKAIQEGGLAHLAEEIKEAEIDYEALLDELKNEA